MEIGIALEGSGGVVMGVEGSGIVGVIGADGG
jgi:hypothetical protein